MPLIGYIAFAILMLPLVLGWFDCRRVNRERAKLNAAAVARLQDGR